MKKRVFQVLDDMNVEDGLKNTSLVGVCTTLISVDKVKQGAKVSMGAEESVIFNIANGDVIPILLIVNKAEYFKRINAEEDSPTDSCTEDKHVPGCGCKPARIL